MVNQQLLRMSRELAIELVATNDVHYTYAEDAGAHDILLCLQTGKRKKLADEDRMRYEGGQYYVKTPPGDGPAVSLCAPGSGKHPQNSGKMPCGYRVWSDKTAPVRCAGRIYGLGIPETGFAGRGWKRDTARVTKELTDRLEL